MKERLLCCLERLQFIANDTFYGKREGCELDYDVEIYLMEIEHQIERCRDALKWYKADLKNKREEN